MYILLYDYLFAIMSNPNDWRTISTPPLMSVVGRLAYWAWPVAGGRRRVQL